MKKLSFVMIIMIKPIRVFYIIALICLLSGLLTAKDILWQRVFDTGVPDYAEGIATDSQGNIIVVGTTIPQKIQPPNREDFLIVKYTPSGDTLWTRRYDITGADEAYSVATDQLGNIIIVGSIHNDTTNWDMHIVKYDSDGNILWTRTYSNGMEDVGEFAYGVATDSKGNIIVTGRGTSVGHFPNYVTLKYDSSGNFIWMREYDGGWEDIARDVTVDDYDNVIVTGYSDSNINWDWCTIKYSPDGDTLWVRRHDVALTDWAFGVATDREGNVIVAGETHQLLPGTGGSSGMVVKYSPQGDMLWTKIFTDTLQFAEVVTFTDVITDDQGNIYLAGVYAWWIQGGQLWTDYYVAKCTSLGDTVWTKRCSYGGRDEASGIALDKWGNVIVTGSTYPSPEDSYERDYFTVKLQNVVSSIKEPPLVPYHFDLYPNYPNPFNALTTFRYDVSLDMLIKITVYDLQGRNIGVLVNEYKHPGLYEVVWNAANFSSGLYFARMVEGNYTATQKMLLIK